MAALPVSGEVSNAPHVVNSSAGLWRGENLSPVWFPARPVCGEVRVIASVVSYSAGLWGGEQYCTTTAGTVGSASTLEKGCDG